MNDPKANEKWQDKVLEGKVALEDVPDPHRDQISASISWHVYQMADNILSMPNKETRRRELARKPKTLQPAIEKEVFRLFNYRKNKRQGCNYR